MMSARALLIALLAVALWPLPAQAQNLPSGSYQSSCQNIDADWKRLSAVCRKRNGQWNYSTLEDYRRCHGDIANFNGRLTCVGGDDGYGDGDYHDGDHNDGGYNDADWTPRGSYQQSCRQIDVDRKTLRAECRDRDGRWRYTELQDYSLCRGDITNMNGILRCEGRGGDDYTGGGDGPRGSWRNSCINPRYYGSMLYAECKNRFGRYVQTSIDFRRCNRDIANVDGRLVCGQSGAWPNFAMITLYRHSNYGGKSRSFDGDVPDLNRYAFGDIASSAVIQGGVWQICDRTNYRGYCIVIDRTQPNFNSLRFNDRAESIRRIR
jgi:hypothetical protein